MKILQVLVLVAVFSTAHSVTGRANLKEAKSTVLNWFTKVEASLDQGVQKLSKDLSARLQTTSADIRQKFAQHKQKFADSEYAGKLAELGDTLATKQAEISQDVEKTLAKASEDVKSQMEATKEQLNGFQSEGKDQLLKWLGEMEKKVDGGVQRLSKDFSTHLEATTNDLRAKFDEQKVKFEASEYAGKMSELSDTLKVKQEEITKDVVKTIAKVSEDVKAQMEQAKDHIKNLQTWMQEEL